jgi:hypothetical protein
MNQTIYQAAVVLHIIGISMMAGATVVDYLGFRKFWAALKGDRTRATIYLEAGTICQRVMEIGMLMIIISGITMMAIMHGIWGEQTWFRVKFGLLILIILNGLGIRRILASRITRQIHVISHEVELTPTFSKLHTHLSLIHGLQFILFVMVFVLSIFKFN